MARSKLSQMIAESEVVEETKSECKCAELEARIIELENKVFAQKAPSINRVEVFNGEEAATAESYNGMKMEESDKIISMRNAIKILPPNMIKNGRHDKANVEAICGFKISDEQMDEAYIGITHES